MEIRIIRIGNSRGIILPGKILDEYGFRENLELLMEEGQLILRPLNSPRKGWEEAFREMHLAGDDRLLLPDNLDEEFYDDWEQNDGDSPV